MYFIDFWVRKMTDFFKSAFGYISGAQGVRDENDFVGQIVELGSQKLRVKRKIAEGTVPHPSTYLMKYCVGILIILSSLGDLHMITVWLWSQFLLWQFLLNYRSFIVICSCVTCQLPLPVEVVVWEAWWTGHHCPGISQSWYATFWEYWDIFLWLL